jgi:hypothetical protein
MTGLRRLAISTAAGLIVTISMLASAPSASAFYPRMTCSERLDLSFAYYATGQVFWSLGLYTEANYWWGKSHGIVVGC